MNKCILLVVCVGIISCATKNADALPSGTESTIASPTSADIAVKVPSEKTTDTVESLSKDVDLLQRELVGYLAPLTPQQEQKVLEIKKKISDKEIKKASLELQNMLGELKEGDDE
ncbi:MAG: hypothetical protein IT287_03945 [Bdellovibrionaceae bacterium]|nr:hypothetical protein [Pseudobdellovibrionaceae bacterium]